jgi:hypothetical protein
VNWRESDAGFFAELQEPVASMLREKHKWRKPRGESTDAKHWGGPTRSSDEGPVMGLEPRGRVRLSYGWHNWKQEDADSCAKRAAQETGPARLLDGSGVKRESHAPFCERPGCDSSGLLTRDHGPGVPAGAVTVAVKREGRARVRLGPAKDINPSTGVSGRNDGDDLSHGVTVMVPIMVFG